MSNTSKNIPISIVTAVYNASAFLPVLIDSIRKQVCQDFEFIIIDGGSTDGTTDIIEANKDMISFYLSEKDQGIYDAWNKGVKHTKGDWIMFLGADDILLPNAICLYINFINHHNSDIDYISSKKQMINKNTGKPFRTTGWQWEWPLFLRQMSVAHPGSLHSKRLFEKYGLFDINYKITGDYEFLLRPGSKLKACFISEVTVLMSDGGASDNVKALKEHKKAVLTTGGVPVWKANLFYYNTYIKVTLRKILKGLGLNIYLRK